MAKYTKETALYSQDAIADDIEDAGKKADNYLSVDGSGIMVYDGSSGAQQPSTVSNGVDNVFIGPTEVDVRTGTTNLASFSGTNGVTLGKTNAQHIVVNPSDGLTFLDGQNRNAGSINSTYRSGGYSFLQLNASYTNISGDTTISGNLYYDGYIKGNGDVKAGGYIYCLGHNGAIGERKYRTIDYPTKSSSTTWTSVYTDIIYAELKEGIWIVHGFAKYESNNTGRRALRLYNSTNSSNIERSENVVNAVIGAETRVNSFATLSISNDTTIVLQTYQNSGNTLNVSYAIEAIRIR